MTKRRTLSRAFRVRLYDNAGGICCLCGLRIQPSKHKWVVEHVKPLWLGGEEDEANMGPAHQECAVEKTADEAGVRSKTTRMRANHLGVNRKTARPMVGGRSSGWKHKMDGTWVRR